MDWILHSNEVTEWIPYTGWQMCPVHALEVVLEVKFSDGKEVKKALLAKDVCWDNEHYEKLGTQLTHYKLLIRFAPPRPVA